MGVLHPRRSRHVALSFATVAFLALAASVSALGFKPTRRESYINITGEANLMENTVFRRRLGGPGSWPPSCRSKCGWCSPCEPVHVPIQPGLKMPLEYYPEAWRCKCGNTLYMP